jgi:soluble lytic murein transglycosylase-like protein
MSTSVASQIQSTASSFGVDPSLALAIATRESGLNQSARGTSGEIGIFQLMPGTAASLGVDPTDASQNISGGVTYLQQQLNAYGGDPAKAAAAYNCGPGCLNNAIAQGGDNWFSYVPASTQQYVISVLQAAGYPPPNVQGTGNGGQASGTDVDDTSDDSESDAAISSLSSLSGTEIAIGAGVLGLVLWWIFS